MSLEEKIYQDYVVALKARNKPKVDFLSFIRSELKNQSINLKKEKLQDDEVLGVLKKQQKRLLDAKETIAKSDRADLIEALEAELALLNEYLPKALDEDELIKVIDEVLSQAGASSMKDMGRVMKDVIAQVGVRADSKMVSSIVKQKLSSL